MSLFQETFYGRLPSIKFRMKKCIGRNNERLLVKVLYEGEISLEPLVKSTAIIVLKYAILERLLGIVIFSSRGPKANFMARCENTWQRRRIP